MKTPTVYEVHRKRIRNMKPVVDTSPPFLNVSACMPALEYHNYTLVASRLRFDNEKIVKNIHSVYRSQGPVDCHREDYCKRFRCKPFSERAQPEKNRIDKENKKLKENLKHLTSSYSQDWIAHELHYAGIHIPKEKPWGRRGAFSIVPDYIECNKSLREICFIEVEADGYNIGRIDILLYNDIVPIAAKNFMNICSDEPEKSYSGSLFYRIFPGLFCLTGDVLNRSGTGGRSSYGKGFPDENQIMYHGGPGTVSMYKRLPDVELNDSQFLITFKEVAALDKRFMVIGKVIRGMRTLEVIEDFGTGSGKPKRKVKITNCGIVYRAK